MIMNPTIKISSPTIHLTIFVSIGAFLALIILSYFMRIEIVSKGVGKIIPSSRVQTIEAEFSGRVTNIHVISGEKVNKDQVLISLDSTDARTKLFSLRYEIERLEIEKQKIDIFLASTIELTIDRDNIIALVQRQFDTLKIASQHQYFKNQKSLLISEIEELFGEFEDYESQIRSAEASRSVITANIESVDVRLQIHKERLDSAQTLLDSNVLSRSTYLDALEAYSGLQKQKVIFEKEKDFNLAQVTELRVKQKNFVNNLRAEKILRRSEILAQLETHQQSIISIDREVENMELKSPMTGFANGLEVHTVGEFVQAGEHVLSVVPSDDYPIVEAVFPNADSGFLAEGQEANIKLDAFPSERFGQISGSVLEVSADAVEYAPDSWGFVVRVRPNQPFLETPFSQHKLRSGMTTTVDVITGERRLISYFFAPIIKTVQESLGER